MFPTLSETIDECGLDSTSLTNITAEHLQTLVERFLLPQRTRS